ncbi:helix-turn-helix domain-containing protein [Streptomyces sp. NBC_00444]|uniref:helix-turn-helix domain-containing protein n=1 Tax=Streptomyces sp. NBC_00444 TaxID=2975744 RepID=UPI002E22FF59
MEPMARDWAHLGEKLRDGRIARGKEQQEVAAEIGVKRGAVRNIEIGNVSKVTPTIRSYAKLVGWSDRSVEEVLDGGEPTMTDAESARAQGETGSGEQLSTSDLSLEVQESLRRGPLLQSRVQEVTTPAGRVRATIVLRGEDGLSQEELLAALRALTIEISADRGDDSVDKSE